MSGLMDEGMRAYYDRRAPEYDDWWLGNGAFADRPRPGWADEVAELIALIRSLPPARTIDIGCGSGFLTRVLPGDVVGVDQSAQMLEVAQRARPDIDVVQSDAATLPFGDAEFERAFTSHVYGHLLPDQRAPFVTEARRVAGSLVLVDAARQPDRPAEEWQERVLNDGSRHRVFKRFFTGGQLVDELGGGSVLHEGRWFVVVQA